MISFGIALSRQHVGVGHARHGYVVKTLAAAVAGGLHAHQAGVLPVLHVADENAVLDQGGAVGGRALIVDVEAAAPARQGAVIDHRHLLRGDPLAHQAAKSAGLLAVEIAFQPVPDRLVQQDARPARPQHHVHLARRRRHRFEQRETLAQRLAHQVLPLVLFQELAVAGAPAGPGGAGFLALAVGGHDGDVEPGERADIFQHLAVGAQDLHRLPLPAEGDRDLPHAFIERAGEPVGPGDQRHLVGKRHLGDGIVAAIEMVVGGGRRLAGNAAS